MIPSFIGKDAIAWSSQVEQIFKPVAEKGGYAGFLNMPKTPGSELAQELKAKQKEATKQKANAARI